MNPPLKGGFPPIHRGFIDPGPALVFRVELARRKDLGSAVRLAAGVAVAAGGADGGASELCGVLAPLGLGLRLGGACRGGEGVRA